MIAIYSKKSICECGYTVLRDEIPLGTVYNIIEDLRGNTSETEMILSCGQCGNKITVQCILVWRDTEYGNHAGFLPKELFTIRADA